MEKKSLRQCLDVNGFYMASFFLVCEATRSSKGSLIEFDGKGTGHGIRQILDFIW
jgi:hypothetical protein